MISPAARLAAGALAATFVCCAHAQTFRTALDELHGTPDPSARARRIEAEARASFEAALREYDQRIEQSPYDVVDELRRCRFIDEFAAGYEYVEFIDEIYERSEQCQAAVAERYPDHPEVLLQQLGRTYGESQLKQGAQLLSKARQQGWTAGQWARLYSLLATTAEAVGDANAADYALRALALDEASDVRLIAAKRLIERGERARALEILTAPIDGMDPKNGWALAKKLELLAELGATDQVLEIYSKLTQAAAYDHIEAARSLRRAGAIQQARKELERSHQRAGHTTEDETERFRFELEFGTPEDALAAYHAWRDQGWKEDPLAINRIALVWRDPWLPWRARDLLGLAGFVAALVLAGAALTVPLGLVHYRGLAKRARHGAVASTEGWQLRHAWTALLAFVTASLLSLYAAGSISLDSASDGLWGIDATPAQLARLTLVESFLSILLLLPLARHAATRQPQWWGAQWSVAKSVLLGAAIGFAMRIPLLILLQGRPEAASSTVENDLVWQLVTQVRDHFGVLAAMWVVALAAPVVEEFVFRGVMLRAFAVHLSFGWANVLQAALFSAAHMNLKGAPMLFVVGLILGWLTRRSGGLLAAMALHAMFNLIAALVFL